MVPKLDELYKNGTEAFEKGDYVNAERFFKQILDMNPTFADIQNKMGIIYNQTNRLKLASEAFEKALEMNPGYTEASLNLAITYSDLGMYDKSREVFEKASRFSEQAVKKSETSCRSLCEGKTRGRTSAHRQNLLRAADAGRGHRRISEGASALAQFRGHHHAARHCSQGQGQV